MRKTLVIASREYQAAVRTKAFLIGLLIMPVLMGASGVLQWLVRDFVDIRDKHYVVVDRAGRPDLVSLIVAKAREHNENQIFSPDGRQVKPRFVVETAPVSPDRLEEQRLDLSDRVRRGDLVGFLELVAPPGKGEGGPNPSPRPNSLVTLRYQTNRATAQDFPRFVEAVLTAHLRGLLAEKSGLEPSQLQALLQPVTLEARGLTARDPESGKPAEAGEQSRLGSVVVPAVLMLLVFMVVMMTSTPLMQGVVEEKMQRVAEVLLGSVRPFELMAGKLLGMTGVSLTISAVYMAGAYWAAHRFGFAESLPADLLVWFVVYQILAALMFGSLFIAIGAACTDMKETQNLVWPVMILACLPLFLLGSILQEPNSAVARGLSFFPFSTPMLMIARQSIPPGIPWWEPALGCLLVLLTTTICVYAAGRIFRVGILMQGKGARLGEMVKWVFRG